MSAGQMALWGGGEVLGSTRSTQSIPSYTFAFVFVFLFSPCIHDYDVACKGNSKMM
jgi:hypothetical protein